MARAAKAGTKKKKKKKRAKAAAGGKVTRRSAATSSSRKPLGNGLTTFAMHVSEPSPKRRLIFRELTAPRASARRAAAPVTTRELGAEAAALNYLDKALASDKTQKFVRPSIKPGANAASADSEFRSLGAEAMPLTGTTTVKFRQTFHKVPVYGSLVTVELDEDNQCLGINSSLGTPQGVTHIAKVAPAAALSVAAKAAGQPLARLGNTPRLYYYFHQGDATWHLAYIIEDVAQAKRSVRSGQRADSSKKDYIVDALSGKLLVALPRTPTAAPIAATAKDGLGNKRRIVVERINANQRVMRNTKLNVSTYDFGFRDPSKQDGLLPGRLVANPPAPWPVDAVGAHANAETVARFLRDVVRRNNLDDRGGEMRSSVNCWDRADGSEPEREWKNAFWNGDQMVYGQILYPDRSFFSIANMTDVVAHEMFHGVTDFTSRLEYQVQPGALNESYSDIFGTIVANFSQPLSDWVWKLGQGFDGPGTALRDMQDPTRHEQPKLMKNFERSTPPYTYERNDYGHVHDNSGIHNFAAYKVMTAKAAGRYVFSPTELAQMFYIALTVHLSRTSLFVDSRRAVLQAAQSLFRKETPTRLATRIRAIEAGFRAAGIV